MADGKLIAQGTPKEVIAHKNIRAVYGMENGIIEDPVSHALLTAPVGTQKA